MSADPVTVSIYRETSTEVGGAARIGPSYFDVVASSTYGTALPELGGALRSLVTVVRCSVFGIRTLGDLASRTFRSVRQPLPGESITLWE